MGLAKQEGGGNNIMSSPRPAVSNRSLHTMRADWEQRAHEDARYYVCTDIPADEHTFYASGMDDYARHVRPFLQANRFDPHEKTALEIGCGVGRMTAAFAKEFGQVVGIDVAPEMVEKARARGLQGARFLAGSGTDLEGVDDGSADFAFSYIVFQHIPDQAVILRYFEEAARVLKPGGLFRFHVNGLPHVEVGGVLIEGYLSTSPRIPGFLRNKIPLARRRRLDSWWGHPVSLRAIRATCARSGLTITETAGRWTAEMWVGGSREIEPRPPL